MRVRRNKIGKKYNALLIVLLFISVGFALLSTTLYINGTADIKGNSWDIYWDNTSIHVADDSVPGDEPTVEAKTKVSYSAELELPGDFYEFTIDAVNNGSVTGEITDIKTTFYDSTGTEEVTPESYIKYSVKYEDGEDVEIGDLLLKKGENPTRQKYKIRIEYDQKAKVLPSADVTYKVETEITYTQSTKQTKILPPIRMKADKTEVEVGEEVTVTVKIYGAAWTLRVSGAVTDNELSGYNEDTTNKETVQQYTFTPDAAGTYTVTIKGDVTDENDNTTDIDQTITIVAE